MRSAAPVTAALLAAALVAACSSSSSGSPASAPSTRSSSTPSSAPASSSSAPSTPRSSASSDSAGGLTEAQATAALLTGTEVGTGFARTASDTQDTPLPCAQNDPPLDTRYPPTVKVEADYAASGVDAAVSEEIEVYADLATVAKTIAAGEQGLGCGTVTIQGDRYTISKPDDITTQLGGLADKAEAWTVKTAPANLELIIAQLGRRLVVFTFAAAASVDTNKLPNVGTVLTTGLQKVKAQS
jgi:hypothetical protein